MYLIDTNIFLEILLNQEKSKLCKSFLDKSVGYMNISDFTLHSIGVILFKLNEDQAFLKFIADVLPTTNLTSLPKDKYEDMIRIKKKFNFNFCARKSIRI